MIFFRHFFYDGIKLAKNSKHRLRHFTFTRPGLVTRFQMWIPRG